MRSNLLSRTLLIAGLAGIAGLVGACGSRVALYAPQATLAGALQVRTFDAYAHGDRIFVKTVFTNVSGQPVMVDRDGFSLKLSTGEVLPRSSGMTTQHAPYPIAPGASHEVFVDFRAPHELETIPSAVLVVGGVSLGADPAPRVVGEIPFTHTPQ